MTEGQPGNFNEPSFNDECNANEFYHMSRGLIEHEDDLINQRVTWNLVAQGFLFVAFATIFSSNTLQPIQKIVSNIAIAVFGLIMSIVACLGIYAAMAALRAIHDEADRKIQPQLGYPMISGAGKTRIDKYLKGTPPKRTSISIANIAILCVPLASAIAWSILIYIVLSTP